MKDKDIIKKLVNSYDKYEIDELVKVENLKFDNGNVLNDTLSELQNISEQALQSGVDAKRGIVTAINSKISVENVSMDDMWELLAKRIEDIEEGNLDINLDNFPNWVVVPDDSEDTWIRCNEPPINMHMMKSVFVPTNNSIQVIGGHSGTNLNIGVNYRYELDTNSWYSMSEMVNSRNRFGIAYHNNNVYCIGGVSSSNAQNVINERYDVLTNTW